MQLTLRETAGYLGVPEGTARRWIAERGLPAHEAHERLYFNSVEVWEWAVEHGVAVSRKLLEQSQRMPDAVPSLADLLRAGGIHADVEGRTKSEVLAAFVAVLPLPPEQDRVTLLRVLEAREALGSTGIGDGIAIPHVRNPVVLHVEQPFVTLALLRYAIEFGSIDGKPVHALFMVVSPTVPVHLRILAQLGFVLRDPELRSALVRRASPAEILAHVARVEATRSTGSFAALKHEE
jgi:PTS system nitrogen regulatory IIA component